MSKKRQHKQLKQISTAALLEESTHLRYVYSGVVALAILIAAFIVWAAFVIIEENATTFGELVPEGQVQVIQHLEGGIVKKVYVSNGERVRKGQLLLEFDPTAKKAELSQLRSREISLILNVERLRAFLDGESVDILKWSDSVIKSKYNTVKNKKQIAQLLQDEVNHLASQIAQRRDKQAVLNVEIKQRQEKFNEAGNQLKVWVRHLELLTEEFNMYQKLRRRDLVAHKDFLVVLREMNKAKGERVRLISLIQQTKQGITASENKLRELNSKFKEDASREMGDNNDQLFEVRHKIEKIEDQLTRMSIKTPIPGTVKGLEVSSGNVLKSGGELMEVVPFNQPLLAQTRINPRDIGFVKVGDKVAVKILTYDYARYGSIRGELVKLSASTFTDSDDKPYYRATIELSRQFLMVRGKKRGLIPGMTVEADIITGEKTLLQYLLKPIRTLTSSAFKER